MRRTATYLLLLITFVQIAQAHECEQNILSMPNTSGYAKAQRGTVNLSGAFTIEFWMKSSSFSNGAGLLEQGRAGDSGMFSIRIAPTNKITASFGFTTGRETIESPSLTSPLAWNHVALVFDPSDSISFYLNGVLVSSQRTSATRLRSPANDSLYFGFSALTGVVYTGAMDECRIWFVPKTRQEIVAGMPNTFFGDEPGFAAYWRFDDDPLGRRFHDFTGNGRDGILVGSAELVTAPSSSPITGPLHPGYMLDAIEDRIWMDTIFCGVPKDTIIHIRNLGFETVEIDAIAMELSRGVFTPEPRDFPLPPDPLKIATVRIVATPTATGEIWDTVIVTPKNVCGRQLRIPIGVYIINTDIEFTKDIVPIDSLVVSQTRFLPCRLPQTTTVQLRNTGGRRVTIQSLRFTRQTGIAVDGISVPFVLEPNTGKTITLRVDQGPDGVFTDSLIATAAECRLSDTLAVRFGRASVDYDLSTRSLSFPDQRLLPATSVVVDTFVEIINTGTSEIFIIPSFTPESKGYKFAGIQNWENLYPGDTVRLKIRFTSNACGIFHGQLIIENAPSHLACPLRDTVHLVVNVKGPEFSAIVPLYKLPATCSLPQDTTVGIINRTSTIISIVSVRTLGTVFAFAQPPLPAPSVSPGDTFLAKVRFAPLTQGKHRDTVRFFTEPCGYIDVPLEGYWGVGEVQLSDTSVEFGTGCDIATDARTITITNTTGRQFSITSKSSVGSPEIRLVDMLPITLKPGESKTLSFSLTPTQFGKFETTFSFTENGCYVFDITARGVRGRANVRWEKDTLQFGEHCPRTSHTAPVKLFNDGFANRIITDVHVDGAHFSVPDPLVGVNIASLNWLEIPITFAPDSIGPFSSVLSLILAPCGDTVRLPLVAFGGPAPKLVASDTLIDFDSIRVGRSDTFCIELRNFSCIPIQLDVDDLTLSFPPNGISVTASTLQGLPKGINSDSLLRICFVFSPEIEGLVQSTLVINDGTDLIRVRLQGVGKAPRLVYTPAEGSIIQFGDVEVGDSSARKRIMIKNSGLDTAKIASVSLTPLTSPYSTSSVIPSVLLSNKDVAVDIVFKPTTLGDISEVFELVHELGRDTISLQGRGVPPGLLFPATIVDFGMVRQWEDSTIDVTIKGSPNAGFPLPIANIVIQGPDAGLFTTTLLLGDLLLEAKEDSLVYRITYSPEAENPIDTASFGLQQEQQTSWLPLRGRGIQSHMVIEEDTVDFATTMINTPVQRSFVIRNTGEYPLYIDSFTQLYPEIFSDIGASIDFKKPIKDIPLVVTCFFEPTKAVSYLDHLVIFADFPEKSGSVYLRGKGTYTSQGEPDIVYRVDDAALRVGEVVDIPVYIDGTDVAKVNADSLFIKIHYDPTVAFVFDTVIAENTLASGMVSQLDHQYVDSTILVTLSGMPRQLSEGMLLKLRVEALLGPIDSTRFIVTEALPQNSGKDILTSGLFSVTDCGDYRTNILLKGPYSISAPQPNPANGIVSLRFELGLDGPVRITISDALGREVKHVVDRFERKGIHQTTFAVDDLPSGSYIYTISSLEYRESGKLLIGE